MGGNKEESQLDMDTFKGKMIFKKMICVFISYMKRIRSDEQITLDFFFFFFISLVVSTQEMHVSFPVSSQCCFWIFTPVH